MDDHSADPQPASSVVAATSYAPPPKVPWYSWRRWGWNFLTLSILAHVLFGLGAAYFIVATFQGKRKQEFKAPGAKGPSAPTQALEHKVQMARKQSSMSAPVAAKRITTTSLSKVALPALPAMKMDAVVVPATMSGMGGTGAGLGGFGNGSGGGSGGGGGGLSLFGLRASGKGLKGSFYDLKQTRNKTPTPIKDVGAFVHQLDQFLQGGWNENLLSQYYKAPTPLYATQIFVPRIYSVEAPKAFGVENDVQPSLWMALYKGQVSPPESGTYYFVGGGDNILIVRLNGRIVFDKSWDYQERYGIDRGWRPTASYNYHFSDLPGGFVRGQPMDLKAGEFYDMEVLLGDDGGATFFSLLVEKQGVEYTKKDGVPILPVFRMSKDAPPQGNQPPFQPDGPVWSSRESVLPTS